MPLTPTGAAVAAAGPSSTAVNASCVRGCASRLGSQSVSASVETEDVCATAQARRLAARTAKQTVQTRSGGMRIHWRGTAKRPLPVSQAGNGCQNKQSRKSTAKPKAEPEQLISCTYAGCHEKYPAGEIATHLSRCLPCPLACHDHCQWRGAVSHGVEHILKDHRSVSSYTGPNTVVTLKNWRREAPMQWITLQACLGQNFLVVLRKVLKNTFPIFFGTVRIFGSQNDADRFEFRMMLKTRGTIGRTFSFSSVVKALHEEESTVVKGDCFVFDSSYAEIFSCEDSLEVDVVISVTA